MQLYKYESYHDYISTQVAANRRKISTHQCATEENIKILSEYLRKYIGNNLQGMCHGCRSDLEQRWFRENLIDADVFGTDLQSHGKRNIIKWDFNTPKTEWLKRFDFVYSNSFDHAYDPAVTIRVWLNQLKPNGMLLIEHMGRDEKANRTDCTGMTIADWLSWVNVVDIIFLDATDRQRYKIVLVAKKWCT